MTVLRDLLYLLIRKLLYLVEPKRNLHETDRFSAEEVTKRLERWQRVIGESKSSSGGK